MTKWLNLLQVEGIEERTWVHLPLSFLWTAFSSWFLGQHQTSWRLRFHLSGKQETGDYQCFSRHRELLRKQATTSLAKQVTMSTSSLAKQVTTSTSNPSFDQHTDLLQDHCPLDLEVFQDTGLGNTKKESSSGQISAIWKVLLELKHVESFIHKSKLKSSRHRPFLRPLTCTKRVTATHSTPLCFKYKLHSFNLGSLLGSELNKWDTN